MATVCRSPPESVPTAWSGARRLMPMVRIASMVVEFIAFVSIRLNGPRPFVGSRPIKKLRVTDISGIIARSWKTVAIPASIASRGVSKDIGRPSNRISPFDGLCTPDIVLIKVDFPAPLSPSRQWHSPGRTSKLTPASAMTFPKCFSMSRISTMGAASGASPWWKVESWVITAPP